MSLIVILIFILASVLISTIRSGKYRTSLLLLFSLTALYGLQPAVALRTFDFLLPTAAITLSFWVWIVTRDTERALERADLKVLSQLILLVVMIAASSYLPKEIRWFVSLPVDWLDLLAFWIAFSVVSLGLWRANKSTRRINGLLVLFIIVLFVGLKTPSIDIVLARFARLFTGQSLEVASGLDLNWLGFSYISFRLLHILRDHRSGRLPNMGLKAFLLFVFFFPALSAGPIDRVERFLTDLVADRKISLWDQWRSGAERIIVGLVKKFVLADSLALIALSATNLDLIQSRAWLWILLYGYSFRIYLDFSGYTDIAIGIGTLSGIHLPENFHRPYLQPDLGAFWNRWHVTLAQWFRAYVFNPLTRTLRQGALARYPWMIILVGQIATMVLIGLWHGVTWNFAVWGAWHAVGLFVHNRWVDFQRRKKIAGWGGEAFNQGRAMVGAFLTFNYVSLGWVWFSTPNVQLAWSTFLKLMGGRLD